MAYAARVDLSAFRNDPLYLSFEVSGQDLTGATFAFAVKLAPDASGSPLLGPLGTTVVKGDPGVRLVRVDTVDGVPVSLIEVIDTKAHMQALPANSDDPGGDVPLAYDFQWTAADDGSGLAAVEQTRLFGDFILKGSINA